MDTSNARLKALVGGICLVSAVASLGGCGADSVNVPPDRQPQVIALGASPLELVNGLELRRFIVNGLDAGPGPYPVERFPASVTVPPNMASSGPAYRPIYSQYSLDYAHQPKLAVRQGNQWHVVDSANSLAPDPLRFPEFAVPSSLASYALDEQSLMGTQTSTHEFTHQPNLVQGIFEVGPENDILIAAKVRRYGAFDVATADSQAGGSPPPLAEPRSEFGEIFELEWITPEQGEVPVAETVLAIDGSAIASRRDGNLLYVALRYRPYIERGQGVTAAPSAANGMALEQLLPRLYASAEEAPLVTDCLVPTQREENEGLGSLLLLATIDLQARAVVASQCVGDQNWHVRFADHGFYAAAMGADGPGVMHRFDLEDNGFEYASTVAVDDAIIDGAALVDEQLWLATNRRVQVLEPRGTDQPAPPISSTTSSSSTSAASTSTTSSSSASTTSSSSSSGGSILRRGYISKLWQFGLNAGAWQARAQLPSAEPLDSIIPRPSYLQAEAMFVVDHSIYVVPYVPSYQVTHVDISSPDAPSISYPAGLVSPVSDIIALGADYHLMVGGLTLSSGSLAGVRVALIDTRGAEPSLAAELRLEGQGVLRDLRRVNLQQVDAQTYYLVIYGDYALQAIKLDLAEPAVTLTDAVPSNGVLPFATILDGVLFSVTNNAVLGTQLTQ